MRTLTFCVVVLAAACGGKKHADTTADNSGGGIGGEEHFQPGAGPTMVPPEKMDEIERAFRRKSDSVSRCLGMVVEAKELPKNSRGKITLGVVISKDGKAEDIKVLKATLESKSLTDCVIGKVKEIPFPEIPAVYKTTYTYAFEAS